MERELIGRTIYKPKAIPAIIEPLAICYAHRIFRIQSPMSSVPLNRTTVPAVSTSARPVAVVDIGATSVRMAIAEIDPRGTVRILEEVSQAVSLGKYTFAI